ncbi:MAG: carboxypeptidase regulatory-like domain-containing protein, partial [Gemmatimonadetes bacterium]|nr:carboxypeptidase regulatory-like domain-containing protein [Gemmatimonadota bacterium]
MMSRPWPNLRGGAVGLIHLCLAVLLFSLVSPAASTAQVIRGRVVDAATRAPITGAHVLLLDASGRRQASVLTNATGAFLLAGSGPGRYGLRVEMIGRRTFDSDPVEVVAGEILDLTLELAHAPIALDALDVRTAQKCEVRPETGALTQTVWEEARKALSIEAAVRAQDIYRFTIERYVREVDPTRRRIQAQDVQTVTRYRGQPFHSKPAEELIESGFFESRGDGDWLFGPNGEVLLSDAFLDTHCFFLRRDPDRAGQIGLAFEPVRDRRIADIEGTLWLDERTAALSELEFSYVNLPASLPRGQRGGRADFLQLPDGAFIVRDWMIYSPLIQITRSQFMERTVGDERVVGFQEEGGEVLRIEDVRGETIREATRGILVGEVWDSIAGEPLVGAQVYLVDTNIGATTGSTGRYRIPNLSPGIYRVSFRHEKLERLNWTPEPVEVDVRPGEMTLALVLPKRAEFVVTSESVARLDSIAAAGRALDIDWAAQLGRPRNQGLPLERRDVARVSGTVVEHATGHPSPAGSPSDGGWVVCRVRRIQGMNDQPTLVAGVQRMRIHVELDRRINFAMQQNDVPVVKTLHLENLTDEVVRDLELSIT